MNSFNQGYVEEEELRAIGFKSVGRDVRISRNCTIVGCENIELGDHVRIDDYCMIVAASPGWVNIGSYVHIAGYCLLAAGAGIRLCDFSGLSHGVKLYTKSDDYSGGFLTNPTVPARYTRLTSGTVTLGRHVIVGAGTVILPRVTVGDGASVGAMSLVTKTLDPWGVYFGCPVKKLKERSKRLLSLEAQLLAEATGRECSETGVAA